MPKARAGAVRAAVDEAQEESVESELRLGVQLRHARLVKGLRLRDVAERSGYSESLISKIENNKATPSLNTLHRIAKVLGKTIATLIGETAPQRRGVVTKSFERPLIPQFSVAGHASDGTEAEVMVPLGSSSLMGAFVVRVRPGGSSDGLRQHEGEEVGFVRTGELLLTVDGETYHLTEGDSFHFSSSLPHGFANPGKVPTEIIWVNTPASL
jgi:transcriptional regulator with XRE-family HTH domain